MHPHECGWVSQKNKDQISDGNHCSRIVVDFLVMVTRWSLRTYFLLLRANIGINADIVVCELAHLSVVDTDNLGFLRSTEAETRDKVHDPEDDGGDDKGICQASNRIGELVGELDPVAVNPATFNGCQAAIEIGDLGLGKKAS